MRPFHAAYAAGLTVIPEQASTIYGHSAEGLYINLFVASEVTWREKGLVLRQETKFPDEGSASFRLSLRQPAQLFLYLRYPAWATKGITVQVNGVDQKITAMPGEFFALHREWRDSDTVVFKAPLTLRFETMPDNENRIAFFAGPILLAGDLGPAVNPAMEDPDFIPLLVPEGKPVGQWLQVASAPLTFTTTVARPREIMLQPFFRLHDCSYAVYWDRATSTGWEEHVNNVKKLRAQAEQMEARTIDKVIAGSLVSETAHQMEVEGESAAGLGMCGLAMYLPWLSGQSTSYRVKVSREEAVSIRCRYFFEADCEEKSPTIKVNGVMINHENVSAGLDGTAVDGMAVEYSIPPDITNGKDDVRVVIALANGMQLTELRVLNLRL